MKSLNQSHTYPARTLEEAIDIIEMTADFYHGMTGNSDDSGNRYWANAHMTALDLLERIKGLKENSLIDEHDKDCPCFTEYA
jgi:hypothetical protein